MSVPGIRLPAPLAERARQIDDGEIEPAPARESATVALVRDAPDGGVDVYMLRRVASMAFAAGAYAFPGGSVDPRDSEHPAGALLCAAVREMFEEAGVLLAGPATDSMITMDQPDASWEADRQALVDRSASLAEMLGNRGLVLRSDLLRPWAHWITPIIERKRFDTRFFVAEVPPGQQVRDVSTEADWAGWVRPTEMLERARQREVQMLPPTLVTLVELAACESVDAVLNARREIRPRLPETTVIDGVAYLLLPEELR